MPVYIGLSSNLDNPRARILEALERLIAEPGARALRCSSLYRTVPWGVVDQPEFYNAVAEIETSLTPRELLGRLIAIEDAMGRRRADTPKWGPRRIDLDLLVYDDRRIDEPGLNLPHPWIRRRDFVLAPLLELAPRLEEPGTGRPYAESFAGLEQSADVRLAEAPPGIDSGGDCGALISPSILLASDSPEQTREIGRILGKRLQGGETLGLEGALGAGKTCFAQGVALALGVEEAPSSPTFLLHRMHPGRLTLHHFDFYRMDGEDDLESIGYYEIQAAADGAVLLIEWADKFPQAVAAPWIRIAIQRDGDEDRRSIRLWSRGLNARAWQAIRDDLSQFDPVAREQSSC